MQIETIRHKVGMSQREFSNHFGIPIGTLRNWEQGISKPPEYVFGMIFQIVRRDKMINLETIKFLGMLEELASLSKNGIENFNDATEETFRQKLFYNESKTDENGACMLVLDACIESDHHDVISYYESDNGEYTVNVHFDGDEPYVIIKLEISEEEIVVEKGKWYFA